MIITLEKLRVWQRIIVMADLKKVLVWVEKSMEEGKVTQIDTDEEVMMIGRKEPIELHKSSSLDKRHH